MRLQDGVFSKLITISLFSVQGLSLIINFLGIIIGGFSVYVTIDLSRRYELDNTIFFIFAAISLALWNVCHFILNLLPSTNTSLAQFFWSFELVSSVLLIIWGLVGFISLGRSRFVTIKMQIYTMILIFWLMNFLFHPNWITVGYHPNHGWKTIVLDTFKWNTFLIFISILIFYEMIHPLYITFKLSDSESKKQLKFMIIALGVAQLSNLLIVPIQLFNLPMAIRFLITDISLFGFFYLLLNHPFIGFYNTDYLKRIVEKPTEAINSSFQFDNIKFHSQNKDTHFHRYIEYTNKFKEILHPVRFSVLHELSKSSSLTRTTILKTLNINSGKLEYHLKILRENGYVRTFNDFIDGKLTTFIEIESNGLDFYRNAVSMLEMYASTL